MGDLSDFALSQGTLPTNNSISVAAGLFCLIETAHTMQSCLGDERYSSQYGGELMGATFSGVVGLLASVITKSPFPAFVTAVTIFFFIALYHWQENRAIES